MLTVPSDSPTNFTVLGLDPGTHNLGVGILHVDAMTLKVTSFEAYTLIATKMVDEDSWLSKTIGYKHARIRAMSNTLVEWFDYHRPLSIASEAAFYNSRTPGAFAALLESIDGIRYAVMQYSNHMKLYLVEPSLVKNAMGVKGGSSKVPMREALLAHSEFKCPSPTPISTLSEHAVDSLAVAYARLLQMR